MATNFPTGLDDFVNYVDGTTIMEAALLNDMQFAIEALQAKVGINSSGVSSSHDYKLANLFGSWTNLDSIGGALAKTEVYKVGSDGFLIAQDAEPTSGTTGVFYVYTDGSNPPTTARGVYKDTDGGTMNTLIIPIRRDDYWKVTWEHAVILFWLPIGIGTCVKQ